MGEDKMVKKEGNVEYSETFKNYCKEKAEDDRRSGRCKSCEYYYYNLGKEFCKIREDVYDVGLTYSFFEYPDSCDQYKKKPFYRRGDISDRILNLMLIVSMISIIIVMIKSVLISI